MILASMYFTVVFEGADEMYKKRIFLATVATQTFFSNFHPENWGFRFFQFDVC